MTVILVVATLTVALLVVAIALRSRVQSGAISSGALAAIVAGMIASAPVLITVTGGWDMDFGVSILAAAVLFLISYVSGRRMATTLLPRDEHRA